MIPKKTCSHLKIASIPPMVRSSSKKGTFLLRQRNLPQAGGILAMYLFHFAPVKSSYGGSAMKNRRRNYSIAALLLSLFLVSCEKEKISEINADPGRFHGKEIQIAGK